MSRPINFYELLDLDPKLDAERDKKEIADRIKQRKREWASIKGRGTPQQERVARIGLENIRLVEAGLADPALWRRHADVRRAAIAAERTAAVERLTSIFAAANDGNIAPKLVARLKAMPLGHLVDEVLADMKLGSTEDKPPDPDPEDAPIALFDKLAYLEIEQGLADLGYEDFFAFLARGDASAKQRYETGDPAAIASRCAAILQEAIKSSAKTSHKTDVEQRLAGRGQVLFRTADDLARYRNSAKAARIRSEATLIEMLAAESGVDSEGFADFVSATARHNGVDEDFVARLLKQHLRQRGHRVTSSRRRTRSEMKICRSCGKVNADGADACAACNAPFSASCFNCGLVYGAQLPACPRCQVAMSASVDAETLFTAATLAIDDERYEDARALLDQACALAPRSEAARAARSGIEDLRARHAAERDAVEALIAARNLYAARARLNENTGKMGAADRQRLTKLVDERIETVGTLVEGAVRKHEAGDESEAAKLFGKALELATDSDQAIRYFASLPPPPPVDVRVRTVGQATRVEWSAPDTPVEGATYVVTRGLAAAANHADQVPVGEAAGLALEDLEAPGGTALTYLVRTRRAGVLSLEAAASPPVVLAPPVSGLDWEADFPAVLLKWRLPQGALGATVTRLREDGGEGRVLQTEAAFCRDADPQLDRPIRYELRARYRDPRSGRALFGEAASIDIAPFKLPAAIVMVADTGARSGLMRWQPAEPGFDDLVGIYRMGIKPLAAGQVVALSSLETLFENLVAVNEPGRWKASGDLFGHFSCAVVRRGKDMARIGRPIPFVSMPPLKDVAASLRRRRLEVSWRWPQGCRLARIRCSAARGQTEQLIERDGETGAAAFEMVDGGPTYIEVTALSGDRTSGSSRQILRVE